MWELFGANLFESRPGPAWEKFVLFFVVGAFIVAAVIGGNESKK